MLLSTVSRMKDVYKRQVFEVRDKDGKVLDTLTTDKNGHAESKELPICTYNEDGSFKEDIHYTCLLYTSRCV